MREKRKDKQKRKRIELYGFTDSKNFEEAVKSLKKVENRKTQIEISYLKELIEKGEVKEIVWVKAREQLADGLTKREGDKERLLRVVGAEVLKNCQ